MSKAIRPRKRENWEFFNEDITQWEVIVRPGGLAGLEPEDRKLAEWFIEGLAGLGRVLDIGCGAGFPGLYVAPHVGEVVGVDAAARMIEAARRKAQDFGIKNAAFQIASGDALPMPDETADGALLCGVLESMDWETVHRTVSEARRVLARGGRIAILDQDWSNVMAHGPRQGQSIRLAGGRLIFQEWQRLASPYTEKDVRYLVKPDSASGHRLRAELEDQARVPTATTINDLDPDDILDAWYDEAAQFDAETLADLLRDAGFRDVAVTVAMIWGESMLLASAVNGP